MSNRKNLSKMKNQSPKKYDPVEINNFLQKLFHSISPLLPINTDLPENYINYYRRILSYHHHLVYFKKMKVKY